jgi:hypothetical protein
MSERKFTEGEWRVVPHEANGAKGFEIAWSPDGELVTDHVYEEANAHLMSASKEMFEALEALLASNKTLEEADDEDMGNNPWISRDAEWARGIAVDALKKARGEA